MFVTFWLRSRKDFELAGVFKAIIFIRIYLLKIFCSRVAIKKPTYVK